MTHPNSTLAALRPPTDTQTVVIPAGAYVELATDGGPHLAVFARLNDATPIIRIRIGPGSPEDQEATGEALADAARRVHTDLANPPFLGGAL